MLEAMLEPFWGKVLLTIGAVLFGGLACWAAHEKHKLEMESIERERLMMQALFRAWREKGNTDDQV